MEALAADGLEDDNFCLNPHQQQPMADGMIMSHWLADKVQLSKSEELVGSNAPFKWCEVFIQSYAPVPYTGEAAVMIMEYDVTERFETENALTNLTEVGCLMDPCNPMEVTAQHIFC